MKNHRLLGEAKKGDIQAFGKLFTPIREPLKSYLFRLCANAEEAEDLAQDTFIKSFEGIAAFQGESSLKTWVFAIATNAAKNAFRKRKPWTPDTQDRMRATVEASPPLLEEMVRANQHSRFGTFEIREHIGFCFTCLAKSLPLDQQIALILKDIYAFKVAEMALILDQTEAVVKHMLHAARNTMVRIFDNRCALVSKKGVCHQCSELNGFLNPKAHSQATLVKLRMVKEADSASRKRLLALRMHLVRSLNPLKAEGRDFHGFLYKLGHGLNGAALEKSAV